MELKYFKYLPNFLPTASKFCCQTQQRPLYIIFNWFKKKKNIQRKEKEIIKITWVGPKIAWGNNQKDWRKLCLPPHTYIHPPPPFSLPELLSFFALSLQRKNEIKQSSLPLSFTAPPGSGTATTAPATHKLHTRHAHAPHKHVNIHMPESRAWEGLQAAHAENIQ